MLYLGSQALFLKAARVNHSCLPNTVWQILGHEGPLGGSAWASGAPVGTHSPPRLVLRTSRPVAKGEELTIDYIPELGHLAAPERRSLLQQEFGFLCDCKLCTSQARRSSEPAEEAEEVW